MSNRKSVFLSTGAICTALSLYQLVVLELAHFYAMFSVGTTILLSLIYRQIARRRVFGGWSVRRIIAFFVLLLCGSIVIDRIGLHIGYWEYPHYGSDDTVRKYIFEWTIALFYHHLALLIGMEVFTRLKLDRRVSILLSMLIFVTLIGFITESLNIRVYSWRVRRMPISNARIGDYFLVFQTVGYWLMAAIPFGLYEITKIIPSLSSERDGGIFAKWRR